MNVVDALVVTVGLDHSKFTSKQEEVVELGEKLKTTVREDAEVTEHVLTGAIAESFFKISRQILQLFLLFLGAGSIRDFVENAARGEAALGILAKALGETPESLSAFDQAVDRLGGSSEGTNASLSKFQRMVMEFNLAGVRAPDWYYMIGGSRIDPRASRIEQVLQLSQLLQESTADAQTKYHALQQLGWDQYTSSFILQGPAAMRTAMKDTAKTAVTTAQTKGGAELVSAWERASQAVQAFGRRVLELESQPLARFLNQLAAWTEAHREWMVATTVSVLSVLDQVSPFEAPNVDWGKANKALKEFTDQINLLEVPGGLSWGLNLVVHELKMIVDIFSRLLGATAAHAEEAPHADQRMPHRPWSAHPSGGLATGGPPAMTLETTEGPVNSSRPLPVKLARLPPADDSFGALFGKLVGKAGEWLSNAWGGGGGGGGGDDSSFSGSIRFPRDRRGRTGTAGFGLYASDIGLAVNHGLSPEARAFLDTIGTGETPAGSYSNADNDPGGLGGRYQFLRSTWVTQARRAGVDPGDFSSANQDKVAFAYASAVVKERTGQTLEELLRSGPDGVRRAIAAVSPGAWNAITNIDPDKSGHSGAVKLFQKKLQDERRAVPGLTPPISPTLPFVPPKPSSDDAAAAAKSSLLIRKSEYNLASLNVHSRALTSHGVARDIRLALQRELEQNMAVG